VVTLLRSVFSTPSRSIRIVAVVCCVIAFAGLVYADVVRRMWGQRVYRPEFEDCLFISWYR
jgi:hypothetical protein